MGKIDLSINKVGLEHNIQKAKENNVIIPTIAQMQHPETCLLYTSYIIGNAARDCETFPVIFLVFYRFPE